MLVVNFVKNANDVNVCCCFFCELIQRKVKGTKLVTIFIDLCSHDAPLTYFDLINVVALAERINFNFSSFSSLKHLCIEALFNKYPKLVEFVDQLILPQVLKSEVKVYESILLCDSTLESQDLIFLGTFALLLRHHIGFYLSVDYQYLSDDDVV